MSSWRCSLPADPPLISLVTLTCNRPGFLRLALRSAAAQTYPRLEVIVVDDGATSSSRARLQHHGRIQVKHVRLTRRASIGAKRNAGVRAARGQVILHWDDDDLHSPLQAEALACPIVTNRTEITALTFSFLAKVNRHAATFYRYGKGRGGGDTGPFLGSLAYHRSVAADLTANASAGPFADASLSEDLDFVERALTRCHRMLPVSGVPLVYTRHSSIKNTWQVNLTARMSTSKVWSPPGFVTPEVQAAYIAAEADAASRERCVALRRQPPAGIVRPLRYPYMPSRCCNDRSGSRRHSKAQLRKPCSSNSSAGQATAECSDTFCGQTKGECSARCTCLGEQLHGRNGTSACGMHCCRFWRRFWQEHPERCASITSPRPLKTLLCGAPRLRKAPAHV